MFPSVWPAEYIIWCISVLCVHVPTGNMCPASLLVGPGGTGLL